MKWIHNTGRADGEHIEQRKNSIGPINVDELVQDAQQNMSESSQKLDLIRHSLELVRQDLPEGSAKSQGIKRLSFPTRLLLRRQGLKRHEEISQVKMFNFVFS